MCGKQSGWDVAGTLVAVRHTCDEICFSLMHRQFCKCRVHKQPATPNLHVIILPISIASCVATGAHYYLSFSLSNIEPTWAWLLIIISCSGSMFWVLIGYLPKFAAACRSNLMSVIFHTNLFPIKSTIYLPPTLSTQFWIWGAHSFIILYVYHQDINQPTEKGHFHSCGLKPSCFNLCWHFFYPK